MAKKVLIADDNMQIRMLVNAALRSAGYDLLEAVDGEDAIESAVANRPDLILLDVTMPKLDGFEVLHFLRKREETHGCHVVMLTTAAQAADIERGRAEGAEDYITKPFEPAALRETVQRLLA
jgi:CheY-like chemotaxis protein